MVKGKVPLGGQILQGAKKLRIPLYKKRDCLTQRIFDPNLKKSFQEMVIWGTPIPGMCSTRILIWYRYRE